MTEAAMKNPSRIKPISYLKANAAVKILALGNRQIAEGKVVPAACGQCAPWAGKS